MNSSPLKHLTLWYKMKLFTFAKIFIWKSLTFSEECIYVFSWLTAVYRLHVCRCCGCRLRTESWSRRWTPTCSRRLERRPPSRSWQTPTSPDWTCTTAPCPSSRSGAQWAHSCTYWNVWNIYDHIFTSSYLFLCLKDSDHISQSTKLSLYLYIAW